MRMSCNGCRVLRKGCSENCSIRPCLQGIKNPESQANATFFLAKFYGRAGLMNLINAGPDHLRPAIFRSLLYEACGRIVNPIYGSVGLLWSGNWQLCQAAVDAVLKGTPILQMSSETAAINPLPLLNKAMVSSYDIRHISKDDPAAQHPLCASSSSAATASTAARDLHKVNKASRNHFKRSATHASGVPGAPAKAEASPGSPEAGRVAGDNVHWRRCYALDSERAASHESSASHSEPISARGTAAAGGARLTTPRSSDSRGNESEGSMITSHAADAWKASSLTAEDTEVELELTLGLEPVHHSHRSHSSGGHSRGHSPSGRAVHPTAAEVPFRCERVSMDGWAVGSARVDLGLDLQA